MNSKTVTLPHNRQGEEEDEQKKHAPPSENCLIVAYCLAQVVSEGSKGEEVLVFSPQQDDREKVSH